MTDTEKSLPGKKEKERERDSPEHGDIEAMEADSLMKEKVLNHFQSSKEKLWKEATRLDSQEAIGIFGGRGRLVTEAGGGGRTKGIESNECLV